MKKEQSLNELKIEQYISGREHSVAKCTYKDTAENIKTIVPEYGQRQILDYLRGIAHNFKLQVKKNLFEKIILNACFNSNIQLFFPK